MKTTISASRTSAAIVSPTARPTALDDDVTAAVAIPDAVDRTDTVGTTDVTAGDIKPDVVDAALTPDLVDVNNIVVVGTLDE